jgi:bacteriorhodopsin
VAFSTIVGSILFMVLRFLGLKLNFGSDYSLLSTILLNLWLSYPTIVGFSSTGSQPKQY